MNPLKRAHEECPVDEEGGDMLFLYALAFLVEPPTLERCYSGFVTDLLHHDDDLADAFTRPVSQEDKLRIMQNPKYKEFYKFANTGYVQDKAKAAMLTYLGTRDPTFIRRLRGYEDCLFDPLDLRLCARYNDSELKKEKVSLLSDIAHTKKELEHQLAELDKVVRAVSSIPDSSAEFTPESRKGVAAACRACVEHLETDDVEDMYEYLNDFAKYIATEY